MKKTALLMALIFSISIPAYGFTSHEGASVKNTKTKVVAKEKVKTALYKGTIIAISKDKITVQTTTTNTQYPTLVFNISKTTKLTNLKKGDLKIGAEVNVKHTLAITRSIPGQTSAVSITMTKKAEESFKYTGKITEIYQGKDGKMITVTTEDKTSNFQVMVFTVNRDTVLEGGTMEDLVVGTTVETVYGPIMTLSLPPISVANSIKIVKKDIAAETFIYEGTVKEVSTEKDYILVNVVTSDATANFSEIRFVISNDTKMIGGTAADIKIGAKVKATYGMVMTRSIPPQTNAFQFEFLK